MERAQRAKQFLPFDAMKGLTEALCDREERHARTERREIGEEKKEINSRILASVAKGMKLRLSCHHAFHDTVIEGRVARISLPYHYVVIGEERIAFEDIYEVEVTDTTIA